MTIKIMIVDDDQFNSRMLSQKLKKRGFLVDTASSAKECLEYLQNETPDLIMLDVIMPEMNGLELLQAIRSVYSPIDIPVIMASAQNEVTAIVEALKMGANDYMDKPINIDIAEARIKAQINAVRNYRDAVEKKEVESMNRLIATYNHEINNPLTIAYGLLRKAKKEQSLEYFDKIADSLQRVAKIVKQIESITENVPGDENEITQNRYKIRQG